MSDYLLAKAQVSRYSIDLAEARQYADSDCGLSANALRLRFATEWKVEIVFDSTLVEDADRIGALASKKMRLAQSMQISFVRALCEP